MALKHKTHDVERIAVVQRTSKPTVRTENEYEQVSHRAGALERIATKPPAALRPADILTLQRNVGNRAVQRMLSGSIVRAPVPASSGGPTIQAKLTIGPAGDRYEQEADRVARQVMSFDVAGSSIQRAAENEQEELQMKPADISITPLVQRQTSTYDEELQTSSLQGARTSGAAAAPGIETAIQNARGGGQSLPEAFSARMARAFGADFSGVRVHTDDRADGLNRSLQARAFTTGANLFFRQGEYNPHSREGQHLIAHELTHVMQQTGENMKAKKNSVQLSLVPGTVIQRQLSEEQLKQKAALQAEIDKLLKLDEADETAINQEMGRGKLKKREELAEGKSKRLAERLKLQASLKKLTNIEEAHAKQQKEAAERQERERERLEAAKKLSAKKKELGPEIQGVGNASAKVMTNLHAAEADVKSVKHDDSLRLEKDVKQPLGKITEAVRNVSAAEQEFANDKLIALSSEQAKVILDRAVKAGEDAENAYIELTAGIKAVADRMNLKKQADYRSAAASIDRGYVDGANFTLEETYVAKSDANQGFGGEYREAGGQSWVLHVHRAWNGKLKNMHTKAKGLAPTWDSKDLPVRGEKAVQKLEDILAKIGVARTEVNAGKWFKAPAWWWNQNYNKVFATQTKKLEQYLADARKKK